MTLSLSLICHNMFQKEWSVLIYYTNILDWNDMAHVFQLLNKYSLYLAKIQFCIHIIILEKAYWWWTKMNGLITLKLTH